MDFRTQIPIKKQSNNLINYHSNLFLLGSCFSENIAQKLVFYKFKTVANPFGILFHSTAIKNLITSAVNQKTYTEQDLGFSNEQWYCFDAHSSLNSTNKQEVLQHLNAFSTQTYLQLKQASHIIITLGTAWVYEEVKDGKIVANCHKIPQKKFTKKLLPIHTIVEDLQLILASIKSVNTSAQIIFTLSPVRHLKDGFTENQQSKAHLLSAIHTTVNSTKNTFYFASYEIMMDELRDYRFYTEDMIHPNKTAVDYIWMKFVHAWVSDNAQETMQKIETIQKGLLHKPFNEKSEKHQLFLADLQKKIVAIKKEFDFISF